jgi:hypothetical protein
VIREGPSEGSSEVRAGAAMLVLVADPDNVGLHEALSGAPVP